jgi:hypothetical protein
MDFTPTQTVLSWTQKEMQAQKNHCNLLSYLTHGQHATHSDGELKAMNIALMQISCRIRTFKKAVILTAAIQATGKVDAPPSERFQKLIYLLNSSKTF